MFKLKNEIIGVFIIYLIISSIYIVFYNTIVESVYTNIATLKTFLELKSFIFIIITVLFVCFEVRLSIVWIGESEKKQKDFTDYHRIFNCTPAILFTTDGIGQITEVNDYWLEVMGYNRDEVVGRKSVDFLSKDSKKYFEEEIFYHNRANGIINNFPCQVLTKNGAPIDMIISTVAEKSASGKIIRNLNVAKDITELLELENALFESEDFYRKIIYAMPDVCIQTDIGGKILYINDIGNKIIKSSLSFDIIGRHFISLIAPEDREKALFNFRLMLDNTLGPVEYNIILDDSSRFTCEINGQVLLHSNNTPYGMVFIIRDITQRKKIEKELKASEEKFRSIIETSPDMVWAISLDGSFTYISPQAQNILGYSIEELYKKRIFDLISPEQIPLVNQLNNDISLKNNTYSFEISAIHGTSYKKIFLEIYSTPILSDSGEIIGLRGVTRDISERKRHELEIKESKEQMEMVLKEGNMGLWHAYLKEDTIYMDETWESLMGYSRNELLGIKLDQLVKIIHPEDIAKVVEFFGSVCSGMSSNCSLEHRMLTKQGEEKWVLSIGKVTKFDSENKPVEVIGLMKDITDSKNFEFKIIEANTTKDKLFSIIAHDLKNPFNSIIGFSELLSENIHSYNTQKISDMVFQINSLAKDQYSLLENILEWANSQRGNTQFNPSNFLLENVINEEIDHINFFANQKNVVINQFNNKINIFADRHLLQIIIRNLITNAIKYTNNGGKVDVYSAQYTDCVEVTISDNGVGMSDEVRSKLFMLDSSKSQKGTANESGTGLGLVLCKELVEKHKGKIWVESKFGEGSRFTFSLPNS